VFLPNLWKPLMAGVRGADDAPSRWGLLVIPFALGLLLFFRYIPKVSYLARWSMAVIVGTYAGLAIIGFAPADLFTTISSNMLPFFAPDSLKALGAHVGLHEVLEVLRNPILIVGLISVIAYFFFSVPHKGAWGGLAT